MSTSDDIPAYPIKLSRDQRRIEKDRSKAFVHELRQQAKGTGWRVAQGTIFRQEEDWFVSNQPTLAFQRGVITRWTCKPMAIDPLFWEIVGLEENNTMPLSFRDQGAWTLRPLFQQAYLSKHTENPADLAAEVLAWSNTKLKETEDYSLHQMLLELGALEETKGNQRSIAVCLLLLLDRFDEALSLCGTPDDSRSIFEKASGGFIYGDMTFLDGARIWISKHRAIKEK